MSQRFPYSQKQWLMPIILATWEAESWRIAVLAEPQAISKILSKKKKKLMQVGSTEFKPHNKKKNNKRSSYFFSFVPIVSPAYPCRLPSRTFLFPPTDYPLATA
jgi:hypothetical protein